MIAARIVRQDSTCIRFGACVWSPPFAEPFGGSERFEYFRHRRVYPYLMIERRHLESPFRLAPKIVSNPQAVTVYSHRSATIGSTLVALRAGTKLANSAVPPNNTETITNVSPSVTLMP